MPATVPLINHLKICQNESCGFLHLRTTFTLRLESCPGFCCAARIRHAFPRIPMAAYACQTTGGPAYAAKSRRLASARHTLEAQIGQEGNFAISGITDTLCPPLLAREVANKPHITVFREQIPE